MVHKIYFYPFEIELFLVTSKSASIKKVRVVNLFVDEDFGLPNTNNPPTSNCKYSELNSGSAGNKFFPL